MKKIITLIAVVIGLSVPLGSCKKLIDHILHNDSTDVHKCRIEKVIESDQFGVIIHTGKVYYNDHNDPDSVIFDFEGSSAGPALFYFVYDDQHRLIEYREDYSREPGDYYFKHTYVYNGSVLEGDTMRAREAGSWVEVRKIHYDSKGRVVQEDRHIIELDLQPADEEAEPFTYKYDAAGNLNGDTYAYDDKVNFMRTNDVWMFTQRNYSTNNRLGATAYNDYGLPLDFEPGRVPKFLIYGASAFQYQCEGK